jgi:hypothetical protein
LALVAERLQRKNLDPKFDDIWSTQRVPKIFTSEVMRAAEFALPYLADIPEEQVRNRLIGEWAKNEACWIRLRDSNFQLSAEFLATLVCRQSASDQTTPWALTARALWRDGTWKRLHAWNVSAKVLSESEKNLVEMASICSAFDFKGFRLTRLSEALKNAARNGFA